MIFTLVFFYWCSYAFPIFPNVLEFFNFPEILAKFWNSFLATSQSFGLHVRKKIQVAKNDFRTLAKFSDKLNICKLSTKAGKREEHDRKKKERNQAKQEDQQEKMEQQLGKTIGYQNLCPPICSYLFWRSIQFSYFLFVYLLDFQWYLEQVNINIASMVNIYIQYHFQIKLMGVTNQLTLQ